MSYDIKDDEITVAFDEIEIWVKENAIFAMNIELSDDFDEYWDGVQFRLNAATQLKVSEKKTWARVNVAGWNVTPTAEYSFNWSKIALSNTKLWTLNYAADTDDVVVAEWTFDISESLVIAANTIVVTATSSIAKPAAANGAWIEAMRLVIAWEDFDAKCADTASKVTTCTFDKKITIEKGGKFQLVVDLDADAVKDATIDFKIGGQSLFSKTTIGTAGTPATVNGFTYEDSKTDVLASDFVGSITLYNLKVTAAKASLENNLTKYVEFKKDQTTTNVVFDWVYTAKKQDLTLTDVNYTPSLALSNADDSVTLNLYIDDQLVSSTDIASTDAAAVKVNDTTTRVKIAAGESVKVRVEADAYVAAANATPYTYLVELVGEDSDGNQAGVASESTVDMKFVAAGSATVTAAKSSTVRANDVLLRASSLDVAEFRVAASNWNVDLDEFRFELSRWGSAAVCKQAAAVPGAASDPVVACGASPLANAAYVTNVGDIYTDVAAVPATALHANDVKVKVAWTNVDSEDITDSGDTIIVSNIDQDEIDEDGISVIISLKWVAVADAYTLTLTKVNSDVKALTFNKNIVPAKLSIEQRDLAGSTEYSFKVEKYESNNTVSNVCFYKGATNLGCVAWEVSDGTTLEIEWTTSVQLIDKITYDVAWTTPVSVTIDKATYNDYFYVEGTYLKVFKAD